MYSYLKWTVTHIAEYEVLRGQYGAACECSGIIGSKLWSIKGITQVLRYIAKKRFVSTMCICSTHHVRTGIFRASMFCRTSWKSKSSKPNTAQFGNAMIYHLASLPEFSRAITSKRNILTHIADATVCQHLACEALVGHHV